MRPGSRRSAVMIAAISQLARSLATRVVRSPLRAAAGTGRRTR
jgi:hypothetical protein